MTRRESYAWFVALLLLIASFVATAEVVALRELLRACGCRP